MNRKPLQPSKDRTIKNQNPSEMKLQFTSPSQNSQVVQVLALKGPGTMELAEKMKLLVSTLTLPSVIETMIVAARHIFFSCFHEFEYFCLHSHFLYYLIQRNFMISAFAVQSLYCYLCFGLQSLWRITKRGSEIRWSRRVLIQSAKASELRKPRHLHTLSYTLKFAHVIFL